MRFLFLLHFFCFITNLFMTVAVLARNPRLLLNRICALLFVCFAIWSGAMVVVHNPDASRRSAALFLDISAIGGISCCSLFVWFVAVFCELPRLTRSKSLSALLIALPVCFLVLQIRFHLIQVIPDMPRQSFGWQSTLREQSIWPVLFFTYSTICTTGSLALLLWYSRTSPNFQKRRQAITISRFGIAVFLICMIMDAFSFSRKEGFPFVTDTAFMLWAIGIVYAMSRYRLFELTPSRAAAKILETMSEALLITSNDGRIRTANNAALQVLQYLPSQVIGRTVAELFLDKEITVAGQEASARTENVQTHCVTSGHVQKPILLSRSILCDDAGQSQGMIFVFRDISQLIRAEKEKLGLEARLRESQKIEDTGKLAGTIAYDFNDLHSAIAGYAGMILEQYGKDDNRLKKYAETILKATRHAGDLNAQLFEHSLKNKLP